MNHASLKLHSPPQPQHRASPPSSGSGATTVYTTSGVIEANVAQDFTPFLAVDGKVAV